MNDEIRYVALYAKESIYNEELQTNLNACKSEFSRAFESLAEHVDLTCVCAPGRVNLIGEHTDYNDGFVFPMAIPLYTIIVGRRNDRSDRMCRVRSLDSYFQDSAFMQFSLDDLKPRSAKPNWINYIIGVVANFLGSKFLTFSFNGEIFHQKVIEYC